MFLNATSSFIWDLNAIVKKQKFSVSLPECMVIGDESERYGGVIP